MKKIVFVTNSRADYGKLKPLISAIKELEQGGSHCLSGRVTYRIFVCGMHLLEKYGSTYQEIFKDGFSHVFLAGSLLPPPHLRFSSQCVYGSGPGTDHRAVLALCALRTAGFDHHTWR